MTVDTGPSTTDSPEDLEARVAAGDPFAIFGEWFALAQKKEPNDPQCRGDCHGGQRRASGRAHGPDEGV